MKRYGILSEIRRKRQWQNLGQQLHKYKNLLNRNFQASKPNEKWVTDVTEFKYGIDNEKKLYFSLILELYDRFPVGYEISEHNDNTLVFNT